MLRNYLAAALRNLVRNRLYTAINIIGLALGFSAALFIALIVRTETTFDDWIPGSSSTYVMAEHLTSADGSVIHNQSLQGPIGAWLKSDVPSMTMARVSGGSRSLRRGEIESAEWVAWADPELADVLPFPVFAGDFKEALRTPDGLVVTRKIARKFFGRDDPIGETLEMARQFPLRIMAVLEDPPPNSNLAFEAYASARAANSRILELEKRPQNTLFGEMLLFFRLDGSMSIDALKAELPSVVKRHAQYAAGFSVKLEPVPITEIHLSQFQSLAGWQRPLGDPQMVSIFIALGILIVVVAIINAVSLMTAQAADRAVEVGIRKVSGAKRRHLLTQFMGGPFAYGTASALIALALTKLIAPDLSAALGRTMAFDAWQDVGFVVGATAFALMTALLSGFYPALVLSAFRPAAVLKGGALRLMRTSGRRNVFVSVQFAVLIGCVLATGTIYSQMRFAVDEAMRIDGDHVLVLDNTLCDSPFYRALEKVPGVRAVACSGGTPLAQENNIKALRPDGTDTLLAAASVSPGFLNFYGLKPLAGRFLSEEHGGDLVPADIWSVKTWQAVVNESAVRKLGFASPDEAVGKSFTVMTSSLAANRSMPVMIVGVAPDMPPRTVREATEATFFFAPPTAISGVPLFHASVRIGADQVAETLKAIDDLWQRIGPPMIRMQTFYDLAVQARYIDVTRQGNLLSVFTGVAIFIAVLGLFGLSTFTAEQRTKEIGIRKSLGATRTDILRLLLWQYAKPVLWANLIAWPIGFFVMRRWLEGFAYHIDLSPWIFLAASALALVVAILTVLGHALLVARAQPVTALRYE